MTNIARKHRTFFSRAVAVRPTAALPGKGVGIRGPAMLEAMTGTG